ncbi:hypothetical protein NQZ68_036523 [Dissostichus eleginoides]|nr:hypothetical protein NQZ68_036523 [Dissostichus eleginoides]
MKQTGGYFLKCRTGRGLYGVADVGQLICGQLNAGSSYRGTDSLGDCLVAMTTRGPDPQVWAVRARLLSSLRALGPQSGNGVAKKRDSPEQRRQGAGELKLMGCHFVPSSLGSHNQTANSRGSST